MLALYPGLLDAEITVTEPPRAAGAPDQIIWTLSGAVLSASVKPSA